MYKSKNFIRLTAFLLIQAFVISTFTPVYAAEITKPVSSSSASASINIKDLKITSETGRLETFKDLGSSRTVVLIQAAHAIGDAQKSIRDITELLSSRYGVKLFGLEGASEKFDPVFLRSFPNSEKLKQVLEASMASGELSGAAAGAVLNSVPAEYQGVENAQLYEEGINLFLAALEEMPAKQKEIAAVRKKISDAKQKTYSEELLALDESLDKIHSQNNLSEALKSLQQTYGKDDLSAYPRVEVIFKEIAKSRADHASSKDLLVFAAKLQKHLKDAKALSALQRQMQDYRTEAVSDSAFSAFLIKAARSVMIPAPQSVKQAAKDHSFLKEIQGDEFFEELEKFTMSVKNRHFRNDEERFIDALDRAALVLERLINLHLSRPEWEKIKTQNLEIPEAGKNAFAVLEKEIRDFASKNSGGSLFVQFYQNAEEREQSLHDNLMKLMQDRNVDRAAIVAGGFHTRGLIELFEKEKISYALVTPAMKKIGEEKYLEFMKGNVSWKNYFQPEKGRVNLSEAFSRFVRDQLAGKTGKEFVLKQWRDELLRQLAAENHLAESARYTKFIDETVFPKSPATAALIKKQWDSKIERLIQDLTDLKKQDRLTPSNLSKVLGAPVGNTATAEVWSAVPAGFVPESWRSGKPSAFRRTRSEQKAEPALRAEIRSSADIDSMELPEPWLRNEHDWGEETVVLRQAIHAFYLTTNIQEFEAAKTFILKRIKNLGSLSPDTYQKRLDVQEMRVKSLFRNFQREFKPSMRDMMLARSGLGAIHEVKLELNVDRNIDNLIPQQERIWALELFWRNHLTDNGVGGPIILLDAISFKTGKRTTFILDGHHRVVDSLRRGEPRLKAHVITITNLDPEDIPEDLEYDLWKTPERRGIRSPKDLFIMIPSEDGQSLEKYFVKDLPTRRNFSKAVETTSEVEKPRNEIRTGIGRREALLGLAAGFFGVSRVFSEERPLDKITDRYLEMEKVRKKIEKGDTDFQGSLKSLSTELARSSSSVTGAILADPEMRNTVAVIRIYAKEDTAESRKKAKAAMKDLTDSYTGLIFREQMVRDEIAAAAFEIFKRTTDAGIRARAAAMIVEASEKSGSDLTHFTNLAYKDVITFDEGEEFRKAVVSALNVTFEQQKILKSLRDELKRRISAAEKLIAEKEGVVAEKTKKSEAAAVTADELQEKIDHLRGQISSKKEILKPSSRGYSSAVGLTEDLRLAKKQDLTQQAARDLVRSLQKQVDEVEAEIRGLQAEMGKLLLQKEELVKAQNKRQFSAVTPEAELRQLKETTSKFQQILGKALLIIENPTRSEIRKNIYEIDASKIAPQNLEAMPSAGVLTGIFQLRRTDRKNDLGAGDIKALMDLIDWLAEKGIKSAEVLPPHETGPANNWPYNAMSAFAISLIAADISSIPEVINSEKIQRFLADHEAEIETYRSSPDMNYQKVWQLKNQLLQMGFEEFKTNVIEGGKEADRLADFNQFIEEEKDWLDDWALYFAVQEKQKRIYPGTAAAPMWPAWSKRTIPTHPTAEGTEEADWHEFTWDAKYDGLAKRDPEAIVYWSEQYKNEILSVKYAQWIMFRQWEKAKQHAEAKGVALIGDMPMYLDHLASDTWSNQEDINLQNVSGVPPNPKDYNADGQFWRQATYGPNWSNMRKNNFKWWRARGRLAGKLYHSYRDDHSIGKEHHYAIPAAAKKAKEGRWEPSPSDAFFQTMQQQAFENHTLLFGEDIGSVDEDVDALLKRSGLIGYLFMLFGLGKNADAEARQRYANPAKYRRHSLAVTGTHDSPTLKHWWHNKYHGTAGEPADLLALQELLDQIYPGQGKQAKDFPELDLTTHQRILDLILSSPSIMAIFPLHDIFRLGQDAEINGMPGEVSAWSARFHFALGAGTDYSVIPGSSYNPAQLSESAEIFAALVQKTGRHIGAKPKRNDPLILNVAPQIDSDNQAQQHRQPGDPFFVWVTVKDKGEAATRVELITNMKDLKTDEDLYEVGKGPKEDETTVRLVRVKTFPDGTALYGAKFSSEYLGDYRFTVRASETADSREWNWQYASPAPGKDGHLIVTWETTPLPKELGGRAELRDEEESGSSFEEDIYPALKNPTRSEIRRAVNEEEDLLFGVHERNPDWWIMRTIGSVMLQIRRNQTQPAPIPLAEIVRRTRAKLRGHGFKEEKTLSSSHIQHLLKRMRDPKIGLVTIRDGNYDFAQDQQHTAIKTHDIYHIKQELKEALAHYQTAEGPVQKGNASDTLLSLLEAYAKTTEQWHLSAVEARWPVLKAIALLSKEQQTVLRDYLKNPKQRNLLKRPLWDASFQLLTGKAPEKWFENNVNNLKGSTIFYISPETWLAAGGLGRVGQYHTVKAKELIGSNASLVTIEPYYSKFDNETNRFKEIDYTKVSVPVENLQLVPGLEFKVNAVRQGQPVEVTVDVYRGTNKHGIEVYLFKDRPMEGTNQSYFINELYKYEDPEKPLPYPSATKDEFTEFFGKASLKLSKRLQYEKEQAKGGPIHSILWTNDAQSAMVPIFKRISDQLNALDESQKQRILTDNNLKWKDLFGGNEEIPMSIYRDLILEKGKETVLEDTHQTGHTYRNMGFGNFDQDSILKRLPYEWRRYYHSNVYKGQKNYTRAGMLASNGTNVVSAIQAKEVKREMGEDLAGVTNGDDREASRSFLTQVAHEIYGTEIEMDFLQPDQIMAIHKRAKEKITTDPDFLKLDPEFANLRSDRAVLSTALRAVEEKLDIKKVLTQYNILEVVKQGGQFVLFANVQADPQGKSQQMFDELKEMQRQINALPEVQAAGGRLIVATGWGIAEQRKLFAMTDIAVYVSMRDEIWGTEAAGFTEADYALNGAVIITSTYLEAIFQQQGFMIDWNEDGIGNTVIPEGDESKHYLEAMRLTVEQWNSDPLRFASYQATSVSYSRSLDALFTAGEYLRTFSRMVERRRDPLGLLERSVQGNPGSVHFRNQWLRRDLLKEIAKMPQEDVFEIEQRTGAGFNPRIKSFAVKLNSEWHLLTMRTDHRYEDEPSAAHLINGETNALENLLELEGIPLEGDAKFIIADSITGQEYKTYTAQQLLAEGLPVNIPEDFQILRLKQVKPENEDIEVSRKDLFETDEWNAAVRKSLLNLIPDALMKQLTEQGYDTEHILWQVQGRAPMEPESLEKKPLYIILEKGKNGILMTLTPSTQGLTDLTSQIQSALMGIGEGEEAFKSFAHIRLEAQGNTLFIGTGKINMLLDEPAEFGVFKKWFREDLLPWAQEFGFNHIQIEQTRLTDEVLSSLAFNRVNGTVETDAIVWDYLIESMEAQGPLGASYSIPDAVAKRFLDFSGAPFVWKTSHTKTELDNPRPGFLGWLFDFSDLERQGTADAALRFHNSNTHTSELGDVWSMMDSFLKTARGLETIKKQLETLKQEYRLGDPDTKVAKTREALHIWRDFVETLSWKIFRDYVAGKEYARKNLTDDKKNSVVKMLIINHLNSMVQQSFAKKLDSPEGTHVFVISGNQIHSSMMKYTQNVVVALNETGELKTVSMSAETMQGILDEEPSQSERGFFQITDIAERARLGEGSGKTGPVLHRDVLESQGYNLELPADLPGIRVVAFGSGEGQRLMDLISRAVRTDTEELGAEVKKELQYYQAKGKLDFILTKIAQVRKARALEIYGEENLPVVMAMVAGLSPKLLPLMKDWHPQTYKEISKAFSRKNDREIYEKGAIEFHELTSASALSFSRTYKGRTLFFKHHLRRVRADEPVADDKIMFFMKDTQNLHLDPNKKYQIRNKITRRLYSHFHTLASMQAEGGWRIRIPTNSRYQILEIKEEEIKAPGVKHKFNNFMLSINISDIGIEVKTGEDVVATVNSFEKLKEILPELVKLGPSEIYIYGGVYKMSPSSVGVHSHHSPLTNFLSMQGGGAIRIGNYDVKSMTYTDDHGNEIKVPDDAGNPFSILRDKDGVPLLNPALFVPSGKVSEEEQQREYRKQFKEFNEFASSLGLGVFYDHIPWYAPEDVTSENYKDFFYRLPLIEDQERYRALEAERKYYRDTILKAEFEAAGIASPAPEFLEKWSQAAYGARKQAFMDSLAASNEGFFVRKIVEDGEERLVMIFHLKGENLDQAFPNPFASRIRREALNYMRFLVDHGAAGVRSDLAGYLLSYGNAGWLGNHYTRPGLQYSAPFDVDNEFWRWLIAETKAYARLKRQGQNYDPKYDGFGFTMEVYSEEEREHLAKNGADLFYFKEIAEDYQALVRGGSPEKLNGDLFRAFQHHTNEWLKLLVFGSNFDEESFEAIGGVKHMQAVLGIMAAAGVPTMLDLRDLTDVGAMRTIPGGKDRVTQHISHTISTPAQAKIRDSWGKYKEAILNSSGFQLFKKLNMAVGVKGQRYFKAIANGDQSVSGLAIQEPETRDWNIALGDHKVPSEGAHEIEFQLPDEVFQDGSVTLDEKKDLRVVNIETGELLPIQDRKIKVPFSRDDAAKIFRVERVVRAEIRIAASEVVSPVLKSLATLSGLGEDETERFAAEANIGFDGVVSAIREQSRRPEYLKLWTAAQERQEDFYAAHPDYSARLDLAVSELIAQTEKEAADFLQFNPQGELQYAFAVSLTNSNASVRKQLLEYLKMVQRLRENHPDAKIKGDFQILLTSRQRESKAFRAFIPFQRAGILKFIESDKPGVEVALGEFVRRNPNGLIYGMNPAESKVAPRIRERFVTSRFGLSSEIPVMFILTDHLSENKGVLKPELLRELPGRIARLHGSVIWNGRELEITADALTLVYRDYLADSRVATMA